MGRALALLRQGQVRWRRRLVWRGAKALVGVGGPGGVGGSIVFNSHTQCHLHGGISWQLSAVASCLVMQSPFWYSYSW